MRVNITVAQLNILPISVLQYIIYCYVCVTEKGNHI